MLTDIPFINLLGHAINRETTSEQPENYRKAATAVHWLIEINRDRMTSRQLHSVSAIRRHDESLFKLEAHPFNRDSFFANIIDQSTKDAELFI